MTELLDITLSSWSGCFHIFLFSALAVLLGFCNNIETECYKIARDEGYAIPTQKGDGVTKEVGNQDKEKDCNHTTPECARLHSIIYTRCNGNAQCANPKDAVCDYCCGGGENALDENGKCFEIIIKQVLNGKKTGG